MKHKTAHIVIIFIILFICSACGNNTKSVYKVVLDPGHGGEDAGAISFSGQLEKDFTLNVALKAKKILEQDPRIEVHMTREDDQYISLENRSGSNFTKDIDLFISIHGNAFDQSDASGTETFYHGRKSRSFARMIHNHIVEATGFNDRDVQKENFFVIKDNKMPAVLLEIGFLTNPEEDSVMFTDQFQDRVAEAIAVGIEEYLFDS